MPVESVPSPFDGLSAIFRWLAGAFDWVGQQFQFVGTEPGSTVFIGSVAAVVAIWAIISQRSIARRQATVALIFQLDGDQQVIDARARFIAAAQSADGLARYVPADPFSKKETRRFRRELRDLLRGSLNEDLANKLAQELAATTGNQDISAKIQGVSKTVAKQVARKVANQRAKIKEWKKNKDAIRRVLNEYEAIAVGIHTGALDFSIIQHYSKTTIRNYYKYSLPYIVGVRSLYDVRSYYEEFETLAKEMAGEKAVKRSRWRSLFV